MSTRLHIKICEAKNVLKMDTSGKSDPYVTLRLKSQNKKDVRKTQIISNNNNPVWNQEFDFIASDPNDMLLINMYDEDIKFDDKMMDELQIPVNSIRPDGVVVRKEVDVKLKKKNAGKLIFEIQAFGSNGNHSARAVNLGSSNQNNDEYSTRDVQLGNDVNGPQIGYLKIRAVNGKDLKKMDTVGKSDPYLAFSLKDRKDSKVKTQIISNNLDPVWNEDLTLVVPDIKNDVLLVNLWDEDIKYDDRMMNEQEIPLSKVPIGERQVFNNNIQLKGKDAGAIHYEYILNEGFPAQERSVDLAQPCKVVVHAMKAEKLKKQDHAATSPYVTLKLKEDDSNIKRTKAIDNDLNPVWNQTFEMHSKDWENDALIVNLKNAKSKHKGEKMMNELCLPLKQWPIGTHIDYQEDIEINKKKAGRLFLGIEVTEEVPPKPEAAPQAVTDESNEEPTKTENETEKSAMTETEKSTEELNESEHSSAVQNRDVKLDEPNDDYCDFHWEYDSKYSTDFTGFSENLSSLSKMHTSEERFHHHHRSHHTNMN